MTDFNQRSYLKDETGPRVVDAGSRRSKSRSVSRRRRESDDHDRRPTKRNDSHRSSKSESGRRKVASPQRSNIPAEPPSLELDVIGQPAQGIQLGMPVETSVMISLRLPASDRLVSTNIIDTSRLFALTSLVDDARSEERTPLDPGSLAGQKMSDSIHPIPEQCAATLALDDPCKKALGYFSFPGLVIRQAGTYRIRTTLVKMDGAPDSGASSLLAVDSEPIRVERRGNVIQRRPQRV